MGSRQENWGRHTPLGKLPGLDHAGQLEPLHWCLAASMESIELEVTGCGPLLQQSHRRDTAEAKRYLP